MTSTGYIMPTCCYEVPIDAEDHTHSHENNMSHKSSFSSLKEQDDGNRRDEEDNLNSMMRTMYYYNTHASGKQDAASILKLISRAIDPESNYGISGEGGGTYPSLNICPSLVTAMNEASTAQISREQEKRKGRVIYMNLKNATVPNPGSSFLDV